MGAPHVLTPVAEAADTGQVYRPPVPEFQLRRLCVPRGERRTLPATPSVGTLLVCRGHGTAVDATQHR